MHNMAAKGTDFFLTTLRVLLRPVVSFAVRRSIKIQDCLEAMKEEFIRQATSELERRGENASTSKLSVITGLHRRDVDRMKEHSAPRKFGSDLLSKIIGQWQYDKKFSSKSKPKKLSVLGAESEFFNLVQSVSKNLNPYTVLFELERAGHIENDGEFVTLKAKSLDIADNTEESLTLLENDLEDLSRSVEENITVKKQTPNLHAKTYFDNIAVEYEPEIRRWFLEKGKAFHEEARKYLSQFDVDVNEKLKDKPAGIRASIGTFSRIEVDDGTR